MASLDWMMKYYPRLKTKGKGCALFPLLPWEVELLGQLAWICWKHLVSSSVWQVVFLFFLLFPFHSSSFCCILAYAVFLSSCLSQQPLEAVCRQDMELILFWFGRCLTEIIKDKRLVRCKLRGLDSRWLFTMWKQTEKKYLLCWTNWMEDNSKLFWPP